MGLTRLSDTCRTRANEDGNCQWSAIGVSGSAIEVHICAETVIADVQKRVTHFQLE